MVYLFIIIFFYMYLLIKEIKIILIIKKSLFAVINIKN